MLTLIIRRLLLFIPMWVAVSVLAFVIVHATPGDPAASFLGQDAAGQSVESTRQRLGLDRPYVEQLASWVAGAAVGDFGESFFLGRSVRDALLERLPVTFSLAVLALVVAMMVGIPLGIMAALRPGSWQDGVAISVSLVFLSVPEFVIGMLLIFWLAVVWGGVPVGGYAPLSDGVLPWLHHLAVPALALGFAQAALLARMTRASMLQVLGADYVRTARAKGLSEPVVIGKHALRNAVISIVTVVGLSFTLLMSGAFITESLFQLPGVGNLVISSVLRRDYPVIQGALLMVSTIVLLVNIAVDVLYGLVNPTITYN